MGNIIFSIIFFIIFGLVIVIVAAPIFLIIFSVVHNVNNKKYNYTDFQKKVHKNIIFTLILGLLLIIVITPTAESLTCNESMMCTLSTEYIIPLINRIEDIRLNNNSYIGAIKKEHYSSSAHSHRTELSSIEYYHALYNSSRKRPQLFQANSSEESYFDLKNGNSKALTNDINKFEEYKKNPANSYHIESSRNRWSLNFRIFQWSFLMLIIMFFNLRKDWKEFFDKLVNKHKMTTNI